MTQNSYIHTEPFPLECGGSLPQLEIAYHTYGRLNANGSNVIWVTHALTANSDVLDWWDGLFGENTLFDPDDHFIVCANNLGSCYGSSGPLSINPDTREAWFGYFPQITIKDIVQSLELLKEHLGIKKIHTLIGGSQGGQIALEWALSNGSAIDNLIVIASNAQHSPWGIAFNESQRMAIKADRTYYSNAAEGGKKGLSAARSIALLSYRGYAAYTATQQDADAGKTINFNAATYQRYQGEKLVNRFNAYAYVCLLNAMDSHNIARGRSGRIEDILKTIRSKTLIVSISSDFLFPPSEQKLLATHIPGAIYAAIDSAYGHDGFLIETQKLSKIIAGFYTRTAKKQDPSFFQNLLINI